MQMVRRLAAAQTTPVARRVEDNIVEHLRLVELAAAEEVTLLVFPELSLTGYELASGPTLAFDSDDARLAPLVEAARMHGMTLVVGAPVRASSGLHIGALIIDPAGGVSVYAKQHLGAFRPEDNPEGPVPPSEHAFFGAGTLNRDFSWQGRSVAVSICADSGHSSHTQSAADRGAQIYLSCQFAIAAHMAFKLSRLKEAARRHGFMVVFANYGGPSGGLASAGCSSVRTSDGTTVARLPAEGAGLAIAWEADDQWIGKTVLAGRS